MLKLSTKGRYGIRAMYEIAKQYPKTVTIKEISTKQSISIPYLEQILNRLKNKGIIIPVKGPGGGYILSKKPEEITLYEILEKLEGPLALTPCLNPAKGCIRIDECVVHLIWEKLGEKIEEFLKTITLKDLLGFNRKEAAWQSLNL